MVVAVTSLLTSCTTKTKNNEIKQTPTAPKSTVQAISTSNSTSTAQTHTTTPIINKNTSPYNALFAPIINAYAKLEKSGYTSYDKIIGDSLLVLNNGHSYNFNEPNLVYAFYDINGDDTPELLIGADGSISGIYSLKNGIPASVIQVESRHNIILLKDINGKCVIEDAWGHMGVATEFFYRINNAGKLETLNKLYTNGDIKKGGEFIGHNRAKVVKGKEVSITEKEYCSLIQKYGSTGYEPLEDTGKGRPIDVLWEPLADYKKTKEVKKSENLSRDSMVLNEDLCAGNEKLVFGFRVKNSNKRLSICISESQDYIVYRFGTKDKVELEYPRDKQNSWDKFSYAFYLRGGGKQNCGLDLNHIKFQNENFIYDIYQDYSAEEDATSVGVIVTNEKTKSETKIEGITGSEKGSLLDFRSNSKVKQVESWF